MSRTRDATLEKHERHVSVSELLIESVSSSTQRTYKTGFQAFMTFLLLSGIIFDSNKLPILSEDLLLSFVTYCVNHLHLQYSTIKLYLCGIRYNYLVETRDTIFETSALPRVQAALTGIKRLQGVRTSSKKPITRQVLKKLISSLSMGMLESYTSLMLKAVMTTAFFGFLRCGEFTIDQVYNKHVHLSLQDLVFYQDRADLTLKQSKTDPFRKGVTITLYATSNDLCPRSALFNYLKRRNSKFITSRQAESPLFLMSDGQALTRKYFIDKLRYILRAVGMNDKEFSGHSFRRGAASTCGSEKIPDYLIQCLGRWKSSCHLRYIDIPASALCDTQLAMIKND